MANIAAGCEISSIHDIIPSYPCTTSFRALEITNGDMKRLVPGQYLNDTLIELGLRIWHHELEEYDKMCVHIFNSFFFSKLEKEGYTGIR
uniref:Uncharacterized protein n=1 Tax=Moniliophthora roreri TaxID=221103 RepID=A0A0W0FG03_MONRR